MMGQEIFIPDHPLESFHLTTDRDLYISGETIWFATHCAIPTAGMNDPLGRVIYAELFDARSKVIAKGKFPFEAGCTSGKLVIPAEQPSGVYYIRVYTQYLKNFHPGTWPMKPVTVVNPEIPLTKKDARGKDKIELFPASGGLVLGLTSAMAIRTPEELAKTIERISLHESDTILIPSIPCFDNGLAHFEFTPRSLDDHYLLASLKNGDSITIPLPVIEETGISLRLVPGVDQVTCQIRRTTPFSSDAAIPSQLNVSSAVFSALFQAALNSQDNEEDFIIHKEDLGPGINYFVIWDESGMPLRAMPYFNLPEDAVKVGMNGIKSTYTQREAVNIGFDLALDEGEEVSHASIAVVKKGTVGITGNLIPRHVIEQPMLLTPQFVCELDNTPALIQQLKALMIIVSDELFQENYTVNELRNSRKSLSHVPESRNISISGYIKNRTTGEPVPGTTVFLSYVGGPSQIHVNETRPDGYFIFPVMPYRPEQDLFLCTFDESPDQVILINNDFANEFPILREMPLHIDTNDRKLLEELYINRQINDLRQAGEWHAQDSNQLRPLGFGTPDISIRLEDYIDLPSMEVVLNEIVPYVKVRKRRGDYRITVLDSETGLSYENHLVMVDNIPLDNVNELMQIHPAGVEQIDVINRTYVIGDHTFQGIIMVKTVTGNFGGITMPPDAVFIRYAMFTSNGRFRQPDSIQDPEKSYLQADFRNVLYWNPEASITNGGGISFHTSDHASDYEVIIRGVTSKGRSVFGRVPFNVTDE